jgi:hypothetical protein
VLHTTGPVACLNVDFKTTSITKEVLTQTELVNYEVVCRLGYIFSAYDENCQQLLSFSFKKICECGI